MITLYRKNSFGLGRWCIWQDHDVIRFGHSTSLDGHIIPSEELVEKGLAGRSLQEQIESRINSRTSKMLDKGYKYDPDEAAKAMTNQLGLITPMLAKPLKASKIAKSIIQPKFNGHRCLITKVDGEIIAYTRQGKPIDTMGHITSEFAELLPEGVVVDGELYVHGALLQSIASLVKRAQAGSADVVYYAYDYVLLHDKKVQYVDRLTILDDLIANTAEHVRSAESQIVYNLDEAVEVYRKHLQQGYEGSMLKTLSGLYESGKRSSSLLKMKPKFDTEAEVIDIVPGDTGLGICVCKIANLDQTFKVLAPGTHGDKIEALENKQDYIGRRLKIEYRELTANQLPFHAVATEWFSSI